MYQIIPFSEPERWERAYAQTSCKDVYYRHVYAELCHCMGDGDPFLGRDSLFQFKHRFNPEGALEFHTGKKVHHPEVYARLTESWKRYHAQEFLKPFFPAYRAHPVPTATQRTG